MKKIVFLIALTITLGLTASAQSHTDGFVDWTKENSGRTIVDDWSIIFPAQHFSNTDQNGSPLGSGLLVLTVLGAGYAAKLRSHSH